MTSDVEILKTDGSKHRVFKGNHHLNIGDKVTIKSGGGGGFGNPLSRKLEAVQNDLQNGYISLEFAKENYKFLQTKI